MTVAIVVPIHREYPTHEDRVSLLQCGRVFRERDVVMLAPRGLDLWAYDELLPGHLTTERVPAEWMSSLRAYNAMMLSGSVHRRFVGYDHMLLHEPDAIVFEDDLDHWCAEDFDYVGAPWFDGGAEACKLYAVGNSGLSLHRLSKWNAIPAHAAAESARYPGQCDHFWSLRMPELYPEFRIATIEQAIRFSWEVQPRRCARMAGVDMPFGMHKWFAYDREFAESLMRAAGVEMNP